MLSIVTVAPSIGRPSGVTPVALKARLFFFACRSDIVITHLGMVQDVATERPVTGYRIS